MTSFRSSLGTCRDDLTGGGQRELRRPPPATCPVRALKDWLVVLKADKGPVFRVINRHSKIFAKHLSAKAVARVVKRLTAGRESRGIFQGTR
jgi:hypothetical protein